jgi:predicted transcriptional regulator
MPKRVAKTRKVGLEIKSDLYEGLSKLARENGQTKSFILQKAVEHYIQFVAPTQRTIRPEMMAHARRSMQRNRKLLQRLAQ